MQHLEYSDLVALAAMHYENLKADIPNAANRIEHIRLTTLAQEAHNLLTEMSVFETGLVYSHSAAKATEQMVEALEDRANQLDLPEFKSPFTPGNN